MGISPLAAVHTLGNALTNVSLGSVAVSFTHTIKALEPMFSGGWVRWVGGVGRRAATWCRHSLQCCRCCCPACLHAASHLISFSHSSRCFRCLPACLPQCCCPPCSSATSRRCRWCSRCCRSSAAWRWRPPRSCPSTGRASCRVRGWCVCVVVMVCVGGGRGRMHAHASHDLHPTLHLPACIFPHAAAMGSNLTFQSRNVLSKKFMSKGAWVGVGAGGKEGRGCSWAAQLWVLQSMRMCIVLLRPAFTASPSDDSCRAAPCLRGCRQG